MPTIRDFENGKDELWKKQHPGRKTGSITRAFNAPIKWLKTIPGLRGEDEVLNGSMPKIKALMKLVVDKDWSKQHPADIEVHHNMEIYRTDGNHRIVAADLVGLDFYPIKLHFYGGSEDYFDINKILKEYPIKKEANNMSEKDKKSVLVDNLVSKAKLALKNGENYDKIMADLNVIASGENEIGGDTAQSGSPVDQEYAAEEGHGVDYGGENDSNKGNSPRVGPRDMGDVKARLIQSIATSNKIYAKASHVETIEIPLKELGLDKDLDYRMFEHKQNAQSAIVKYLTTHVYKGRHNFTIVKSEREDDKFFVDILVFDHNISHVAEVQTSGMVKKAWRKRQTVALGTNDKTGLVSCPIENNFLVRSCSMCPLAGNPETYVEDGYVDCHFTDISSWLNGMGGVKEHQPKDNSSSA